MRCSSSTQSMTVCVGHWLGVALMLSSMRGVALPDSASAEIAASLRISRSLRGLQKLRWMRPSTNAIRPSSMRARSAAGITKRLSTPCAMADRLSRCAVNVSLPRLTEPSCGGK